MIGVWWSASDFFIRMCAINIHLIIMVFSIHVNRVYTSSLLCHSYRAVVIFNKLPTSFKHYRWRVCRNKCDNVSGWCMKSQNTQISIMELYNGISFLDVNLWCGGLGLLNTDILSSPSVICKAPWAILPNIYYY